MKLAQCWDDGVLDDVRVMEILRKHGAKASFNLNAGLHRDCRYAQWTYQGKEVLKLAKAELVEAYQGFTVANHSLTHAMLAEIDQDTATRDIVDGRDALEQIFGCPVVGFAYPCDSRNAAVKEIVRSAGHVYARTTANVDHALPVVDAMEFHPNCHFLASDFWDRFDRAKQADELFYFWGHSYEIMTEEDWLTFDRQIGRLSATPEAIWVDLPSLFGS